MTYKSRNKDYRKAYNKVYHTAYQKGFKAAVKNYTITVPNTGGTFSQEEISARWDKPQWTYTEFQAIDKARKDCDDTLAAQDTTHKHPSRASYMASYRAKHREQLNRQAREAYHKEKLKAKGKSSLVNRLLRAVMDYMNK